MIIWKTHRAALSGAYHPWMNGVFIQRGFIPAVALPGLDVIRAGVSISMRGKDAIISLREKDTGISIREKDTDITK